MPAASATTLLPPRQRRALSRLLLNRDVRRCSPAALASLARRGFTLGDAAGHALTTAGRRVAEACAAFPNESWVEVNRATLTARCIPPPARRPNTNAPQ